MLKNLRIKIFTALLNPFSAYARNRRTREFLRLMKPHRHMRILDVGGQPEIWDYIDTPLVITCLNLPGIAVTNYPTHHEISFVEGDACNMPEFNHGDFDLVFSNSVIEHVGGYEKRKAFAREINRLSKNIWIQTPCKYYPIEAHCGIPFWWFYPKSWRSYFLERLKKELPAWAEMIEGTDIVCTEELKELFPDAKIFKEWVIFPKSTIVYSCLQQ